MTGSIQRRWLLTWVCCWALFAAALPLSAHTIQVEPVVVAIQPRDTFFTVEMKGNGEDIIQAVAVQDSERRGNDFVPDVSRRLEKYINAHLKLRQGDTELRGEMKSLDYWRPDNADYTKSRFTLLMRYERDPKLAGEKFVVTSSLFDYLPNAQTILSIGGVQKVLQPGQTVEFDPSAVALNLWNNVRDFALMGIEHIFTGPDHMLFIVALLLVSTSFWSLVKTLTGFTIAHSVTLILSALEVIDISPRLVEIVVALSIMYVGLENIYVKNAVRHRFVIAAAFGLIHGFAFSGYLREQGLPEQGLIWCLLSFNLGVEIAQVAICAIAFPLMMHAKKRFEEGARIGGTPWPKAMHAMSWAVVAAGGYWMMQRIIG